MAKGLNLLGLKRDLEKYTRILAKEVATRARDELTMEAELAIGAFYSDYTPEYYHRRYYNFTDKSFKKYYSNAHNNRYIGGVEFTPDEMDDIYRKNTPQEVFGSVVELGSHGPEGFTPVPPMSISPMQMVYKKQEEILNNIDSYIESAKEKANQGSYSVLFN